MALAVCALFDAAGERLIRGLWARLEDAGIGSLATHTHGHHHPHLSFAVLREWELDCVRDTLGRLPDGGGFPANVQGTFVFPRGRVALDRRPGRGRTSPGPGHLGTDVHRRAAAQALQPDVVDTARLGGDASPGALLPVAVTAISDVLPATLTIARAALVDTATGETWPLPGIPSTGTSDAEARPSASQVRP